MKKLIPSLLIALFSVAAFAEGSSVAPNGSATFDVKIKQGERLVFATTAVATPGGRAAPIETVKRTAYLAAASTGDNGVVSLVTGDVETGVRGSIDAAETSNQKIKAHITLSISELVSMDKTKTKDGVEVSKPNITGGAIDQELSMIPGEMVTLKANSYTVFVVAKRF